MPNVLTCPRELLTSRIGDPKKTNSVYYFNNSMVESNSKLEITL